MFLLGWDCKSLQFATTRLMLLKQCHSLRIMPLVKANLACSFPCLEINLNLSIMVILEWDCKSLRNNKTQDLSSSLWSSASNVFGNSSKWLDRLILTSLKWTMLKKTTLQRFFWGASLRNIPTSSLVLHIHSVLKMTFPWIWEILLFLMPNIDQTSSLGPGLNPNLSFPSVHFCILEKCT